MASTPSSFKPPITKAAEPVYGQNFDPWNSVALGHQRRESGGPHGWSANRARKLQSQFSAGNTGGDRIQDTAGPCAVAVAPVPPTPASCSGGGDPASTTTATTNTVLDLLRKPGTMRPATTAPPEDEDGESTTSSATRPRKLLDGVVVYVNGSTHPLISDHRLKHVLVQHGAHMALHLARRSVTHVIVGAQGRLAGGKIEKEVRRLRGCGVKFVGVEWVLDSIKAGIRLPEARFARVDLGQKSVLASFARPKGRQPQPRAATAQLGPFSSSSASK